MPRFLLLALFLAGVTAAVSHGEEPIKGRALLVGVSRYPTLPISLQLPGPGNDVELMKSLLEKRFKVSSDRIVALSEDAGKKSRDLLPTRAAIEREFEAMIAAAQPGEFILILLSGHGSQQPDLDLKPEVDPEPDGYDEIFLPRDVERFEDKRKPTRNAIVDDQLGEWLAKLRGKGAFVFLIADCCCSGSISRGSFDEVARFVPSEAPPAKVVAGAAEKDAGAWLDGGRSGIVALYAAQANERAKECRAPGGSDWYGRLTYCVNEALEQSDQPLTYRELAQQVQWKFATEGWTRDSNPYIRGDAADLAREFLGERTWPKRSQIVATRGPANFALNVGLIHGLGEGSLLQAFPIDGDKPLGMLEVTSARMLDSRAVWRATKDQPIPQAEIARARCELIFRDPGDLRVTVGLQFDGLNETETVVWRNRLSAALAELTAEKNSLIRLAGADRSPTWYLVAAPGGIYLQHAGGALKLDNAKRRTGELKGPLSPAEAERKLGLTIWLRDELEQIARAEALIRLSERESAARRPLVNFDWSLQVNGKPEQSPQAAVYKDKDRVEMTLKNTGLFPGSVVVFYVDNAHQIGVFFPLNAGDEALNKIQPGETLKKKIGFNINDNTVGMEHVVIVGVRATEDQAVADLLLLGGMKLRRRAADAPPLRSPLGRLIESATTGVRGDAGLRREFEPPQIGHYSVRRLGWTVTDGGK